MVITFTESRKLPRHRLAFYCFSMKLPRATMDACRNKMAQVEAEVLAYALEAGKLEYAELGAGEALLILPRAGHAVLTSDFKVVVAAEYHWKGENRQYGRYF